MRSPSEVERVLALVADGHSTSDIARLTDIPRSTVKDWRGGRLPTHESDTCEDHAPSRLDQRAYAYVLGMYLGDGCISSRPRGVWHLRITLDAAYPEIAAECVRAVAKVTPGKVGIVQRRDCRAIVVSNHWKHWTCLIPQHGPGRKHLRPILLTDWQRRIVSDYPEPFLRGLIHSDGTRIIAIERKGAYVRRAPRYVFSNCSEDILGLFREACRTAGVHCTRSSVRQISVYSKEAVARLDGFVGPKR